MLSELLNSPLALHQSGMPELLAAVEAERGIKPEQGTKAERTPAELLAGGALDNLAGANPAVSLIPITGLMTKYSRYSWFETTLGMDSVAEMLAATEQNPNIVGTILLLNTYGGSTQSWIRLEEVLRARKKPVYAVVDGMCASAGMYVACLCDKILALHSTCRVGSIGVMAQMVDSTDAEKQAGLRMLEFYPPESKYKNLAEREALSGDEQRLLDEELSPLARHFQEHVRSCRPALDLSVEGLLEGKMFFAQDAIDAGLIDGISTLQAAINEVAQVAELNTAIKGMTL